MPSDAEWSELEDYVSSQDTFLCNNNSTYIAKALAATTGWTSYSSTCAVGYNQSSNDATGFGALPVGFYGMYINNGYHNSGSSACFWSATENSSFAAWYRSLDYDDANLNRSSYNISIEYSVRCLRD